MRVLAVYYSLEGNCREVAGAIAGATGGAAEALRPEREIAARGWWRFVAGGVRAMWGRPGPNQPLAADPSRFGLVFVGTPVWAWRMSPPVRRFLSETAWNGQKVALFALHGGAPGRTLRAMRGLVEARGGRVASEAAFLDLRRGDADETRRRAAEWAARTAGAP